MGKQAKVPCPRCGELYAWNASKNRVRNHGSCQFDAPVQKKPGFRVVIAQPSNVSSFCRSDVSSLPSASVASAAPAREKEDLEEFYRQNILENQRLSREAKARHEEVLKEKAARDEQMRKEQAARDEEKAAQQQAEADRLLKIELDRQRFYQPWNTALTIKATPTGSAIPIYWMDRNGGFYEVGKDTPYTPKPSPSPVIRRRQRKVWCKVYWNSKFGDTTDLCEGEWEMQWAMRWVRVD